MPLQTNVTESYLAGKQDRRADEQTKLSREKFELLKDQTDFDRGVTKENLELAKGQEARLGRATDANIKSVLEQGERANRRLALDEGREERFKKNDEQLYEIRAAELSNILRMARRNDETWEAMRDPKVLEAMARIVDPNSKSVDPKDFTYIGTRLGADAYGVLSGLRRESIETQGMIDRKVREDNMTDIIYQQQVEALEKSEAANRTQFYDRLRQIGVNEEQVQALEFMDMLNERLTGRPDKSLAENSIDATTAYKNLLETFQQNPEEVFQQPEQKFTPTIASSPKEQAQFRVQQRDDLLDLLPSGVVDIKSFNDEDRKVPKDKYRDAFDLAERIANAKALIDPTTGMPFPDGGTRTLSIVEQAKILEEVGLPVNLSPQPKGATGFGGLVSGIMDIPVKGAQAFYNPAKYATDRRTPTVDEQLGITGGAQGGRAGATGGGAPPADAGLSFRESDVQSTIDRTILSFDQNFGDGQYDPQQVYFEVGKALRKEKGSPLTSHEIRYINTAVGNALLGGGFEEVPTPQEAAAGLSNAMR